MTKSSPLKTTYYKNPKSILLIFVDGLGIGENDPLKNPCAQSHIKIFNNFLSDYYPKPLTFNGLCIGLDASLGIEGLPQSATGQTALFTGVNAAAVLGRHLNGYPNEKCRQILAQKSILKHFKQKDCRAAFINTFRPPFFDYNPYDIIRHLSVTSVANLYADLPFFGIDDLKAEKSIYQEFTNQHLRDKGFDVPIFTPQKAGKILAVQSSNYDFCLYEYFQTDIAGHSCDINSASQEINKLEQFIHSVLMNVNLKETLVVLTSDHGNIEDVTVRGHTTNPAMTMVWGASMEYFIENTTQITDVTPSLLSIGLSKDSK